MREEMIEALGGRDGPLMSGPIEDQLRAVASEDEIPDSAIVRCVIRFEDAAPALRAVLAKAAGGAKLTDDEGTLLWRGRHILGGAQDHAAWPDLLRLLRLSSNDLDDLIGDVVTVTLPQIAIGIYDGDVDGLLDLIADRAVDEFVRDAMLGTAAFLTWDGRIERDRMERFLVRFYDKRMAEDQDTAWFGWLQAISILGLRPLAPLVHQAWNAGYMADGVMEPSDFEADLKRAEENPDDFARFKEHNLGIIEDLLESLDWARLADDDVPFTDDSQLAADEFCLPCSWIGTIASPSETRCAMSAATIPVPAEAGKSEKMLPRDGIAVLIRRIGHGFRRRPRRCHGARLPV